MEVFIRIIYNPSESIPREAEQKNPGFSLINDKYKHVISPMVFELATWKTGRKPLVKINHTLLNSPTTVDDQINYNKIRANKVDSISEMPLPKGNQGTCKFMNEAIDHINFITIIFNDVRVR